MPFQHVAPASGATRDVLPGVLKSLPCAGLLAFLHRFLIYAQDRRWKPRPRSCCFVAGTWGENVPAWVPAWAGTRGRWLRSVGRVLLGLPHGVLPPYLKAAPALSRGWPFV